jgi:phospholipase C
MRILLLFCLVYFAFGQTYPIKNVVLLMLENRSFDHMCGFLKRINPSINGLTGKETNPINVTDPAKGYVTVGDTAPYVARFDPDHSLGATTEKIFGFLRKGANPAPMDGFVQTEESLHHTPASDVMNMFTPERVPIISTLAQEFAISDSWFASVPGPTHPNRLYSMTATSRGTINNDVPTGGFTQDTIFQRVEEVGKTWGVYYTDQSWAVVLLSYLRTSSAQAHIKKWPDFLDDAKAGKLPNYVWLEPRFASTATLPAQDQHPDHPIPAGEAVMKEVYEALRASPQWNSTLFIITYDEHGGYYDHYPTPQDGIPNPDGISPVPPTPSKFNFERLGIRVPTVLISPWINKGVILNVTNGPTPTSRYDHSSIAATVKKLFQTKTFLTKRDAWAATFEGLFTVRTTPRTDCPTKLPNPPPMTKEELIDNAYLPLNDLQCAYFKAFPGSNGNCDMTQEQASKYAIDLMENFRRNLVS